MGQCSGPDDIYLAFRGLRTMKIRLEKSFNSSLNVADWIANQPNVINVFHPATKYHPDFKIFRRDFSIGAGLFSFELKEKNLKKLDKFIDNLKFFGIGASFSSFLFFFILGYLSKFLSNYISSERLWKTINYSIVLFMSLLSVYVFMSILK